MLSKKMNFLWVIWFVTWPIVIAMVFSFSSFTIPTNLFELISFLILLVVVASFPIMISKTPVFFINGISMAIFLYYGLFIEIIMTQLATIALLIKIRVGKHDHYRIPLNSLMFLIMSTVSGAIYYSLGGESGVITLTVKNVLLIIVYGLSIFLTNHLLLFFIRKFITKQKEVSFLTKTFFLEAYTTLLVFPVGLILYILYVDEGISAIFYVGMPFVAIAFIFKLYYSTQKVNDFLQQASEIGYQLTSSFKVDEVIDIFLKKLFGMMPVEYAFILHVRGDHLEVISHSESGEEKPLENIKFKKGEGIAGRAWVTRRPQVYSKRSQWNHLSKGHFSPHVESLLVVPIEKNHEVYGVIGLASVRKYSFEKFHVMIVKILGAYLGVAIENAKIYEQTKQESERCPLTNLYNYRYFEKIIGQYFPLKSNEEHVEEVSLIILDVDHFKKVNDTYGHQGGDDILCELAQRLLTTIGDSGVVSRYGGEEFLILLPNVSRDKCFRIAENIRLQIALKPFSIKRNIESERVIQNVQVTVSIGIASAPVDADEPVALIRHADRAMYVGAKQKGRNRVAGYEK